AAARRARAVGDPRARVPPRRAAGRLQAVPRGSRPPARQRAVLPALRRSPRGQDGCLALPAVPRARRRRRGAGADRDPAHREGSSIGASGAVAAAVAAYLLLQPRARVTAGVPVVVLPVLVQVPPFVPAALWGALQARPVTRLL